MELGHFSRTALGQQITIKCHHITMRITMALTVGKNNNHNSYNTTGSSMCSTLFDVLNNTRQMQETRVHVHTHTYTHTSLLVLMYISCSVKVTRVNLNGTLSYGSLLFNLDSLLSGYSFFLLWSLSCDSCVRHFPTRIYFVLMTAQHCWCRTNGECVT